LEAISASYGHFPIVGSHKHHIRADLTGLIAPKGEKAKEMPAADLQIFEAVPEHWRRQIVTLAQTKTGGYTDLSIDNIAAFWVH
jgi:hypothetical protein